MSTLLAIKLKCTANNGPMNHNWSLGIDLEENVALGMLMRFEAGDCAIVVSIKRAFKCQNSTDSKMDIIGMLHS